MSFSALSTVNRHTHLQIYSGLTKQLFICSSQGIVLIHDFYTVGLPRGRCNVEVTKWKIPVRQLP